MGYEAFDQGKSLGKVLAISDSGLQQLLHFEINGTEVLVPLQDELITDINEKKKQLFLELPEGLVDLFFEG
ncbi:MAG: ribosome maturation factor RimM [Bacteroidia bacterium]